MTDATLYEWCLISDIRPLDINPDNESDFMLNYLTYEDFNDYLKNGNYKEKSTPRKPEKYLEFRMYGLVPYNLSPIQQGIQFNHANDEYRLNHGNDEDYIRFLTEWKTNIILNGGTSNEGHLVKQGFKEIMYTGSMQGHLNDLESNEVKVSTFYEPDLNSMLTAIIFLVDERVFNKKLYPNYVSIELPVDATIDDVQKWSVNDAHHYNNWVTKIGGPKNAFLREFLIGKKLA